MIKYDDFVFREFDYVFDLLSSTWMLRASGQKIYLQHARHAHCGMCRTFGVTVSELHELELLMLCMAGTLLQ